MKGSRVLKRLLKAYARAYLDNDYMMSMGGGIYPYPTFVEWCELGGDPMPSWRDDLERRREIL